jgi:hypothetical protein
VSILYLEYRDVFQFEPFSHHSTGPHFADKEWDAASEVLAYSYALHQRHFTAQAVKLFNLVNSLADAGWGTDAALRFLASLAGEVRGCPQDTSTRLTPSSEVRVRFVF